MGTAAISPHNLLPCFSILPLANYFFNVWPKNLTKDLSHSWLLRFLLPHFLTLNFSLVQRLSVVRRCSDFPQPIYSFPFLPQWFQVTLLLYDSTRMRQLLSKSVVIDDDDDDEYPWRQNAHKYYIHLTLSLFLFLWFILGNYWVFSVYLPNFIPPFHQPQDYCDKTLYIFAVGVLIISHTVLFLLIFCSCCIYFFSRQRYSSEED